RENLRLFVNVMEALKELGVQNPWDHVMIGDDRSWAMTLIKRSRFTEPERERIRAYFLEHGTQLIYPSEGGPTTHGGAAMFFAAFVDSLKTGREKELIARYPFDISIVTDDKPFFYKQYKFSDFNPFEVAEEFDVGTVVFMT